MGVRNFYVPDLIQLSSQSRAGFVPVQPESATPPLPGNRDRYGGPTHGGQAVQGLPPPITPASASLTHVNSAAQPVRVMAPQQVYPLEGASHVLHPSQVRAQVPYHGQFAQPPPASAAAPTFHAYQPQVSAAMVPLVPVQPVPPALPPNQGLSIPQQHATVMNVQTHAVPGTLQPQYPQLIPMGVQPTSAGLNPEYGDPSLHHPGIQSPSVPTVPAQAQDTAVESQAAADPQPPLSSQGSDVQIQQLGTSSGARTAASVPLPPDSDSGFSSVPVYRQKQDKENYYIAPSISSSSESSSKSRVLSMLPPDAVALVRTMVPRVLRIQFSRPVVCKVLVHAVLCTKAGRSSQEGPKTRGSSCPMRFVSKYSFFLRWRSLG